MLALLDWLTLQSRPSNFISRQRKQKMRFAGMLLAAIALLPLNAEARDSKVIREFKREVPCPATQKRRGPCPGYHADHIVALCAGGADHWSNMQWLTVPAHKVKTREDVRACAVHRRSKKYREAM